MGFIDSKLDVVSKVSYNLTNSDIGIGGHFWSLWDGKSPHTGAVCRGNFELAEVLIYDKAITANVREKIEQSLSRKYNILLNNK